MMGERWCQLEHWTLYAEPGQMGRAFDRSLYVLGAFEGEKLPGYIR